ncbi:hypothetical protein B9Z19DRAFT_965565 [Tuber borchii]|uniref:Ubiquitin-protein ligase Sel1/Ubx2 n=1 Tax=Tuber borchii TaxID=42251 RepID=A0A2T7A5T5_TUBBO|nr:hypothetical protein B9Z19DRAFT_965565 [Tuber borchii]
MKLNHLVALGGAVSLLAGNVAAATGGGASLPIARGGDPESSTALQQNSQERLLENRKPPDDSTTTAADGDNDDANEHSKQAAAVLVNDALAILRTLDPTPSQSTYIVREGGGGGGRLEGEGPDGLLGLLSGYIKQVAKVLLLYTPSTLEEPVDGGTKVTVLGKKLAAAVEKLETAGRALKSPDAIYLLAQMNFYGNWSYPRNYPVAFEKYKRLADLTGNSTAQNMVGFMYATGIGGAVERDQSKALLYHTFAALNGETRSEMTAAFRHHTGIGTPRRCEEAAFYYKRVADKAMRYWRSGPPGGHALIKHSYRLADDEGGVYGEGASVASSGMNAVRRGTTTDSAKDLDDILEYLDLMAHKGDLSATFSLAKLYYDGSRNLPRDLKRARVYFMNVAKQYWSKEGKSISGGPPGLEKLAGRAAGYLGKMYLRGEGFIQNYVQAVKWFELGVENGDASSQNGLGYMYLHGYGVKADRVKAAEFFQTATEQDLPQGQINLGKIFLEQNDIETAKRFFELAARHGTLEAYYFLAEIYNSGLGKERSCALATAYYKIVAERVEPLHSPLAWANKAYADGDKESAIIGYMMAAEQGYEAGQANVAFLLDQEKSRLDLKSLLNPKPKDQRNQELALIYWTRSAKQSNTDSLVKMGDYYLSGVGTEQDAAKAASCYTAASELQASAQALWNLGWMHENGIGVEQDFHLAKRYYDLALETNQEAYLPVTLSLFKLRLRSFWNTITGGNINAIGADPDPKPKKSLTLREFFKQWYEAAPDEYADPDDIFAATAAPDGDIHGDEYYDAEYEGDLVESVIILALAAAVAILVYYRQQRQQQIARRQQQQGQQGQQGPEQGQGGGGGMDGGGMPGMGGEGFGQWGVPH